MEAAEEQQSPYAVDAAKAQELIASGAQLIDVRAEHEWDAGHIAGARHIELNELAARSEELDRGRPVIFYCRTGNRSEMPAAAFGEAGYDAHNLAGGITDWIERGLPTEPEDAKIAEPGYAQEILHARGSLPPPR